MIKSENHINLALHKPSNKIIGIQKARRGLACKCICIECNGKLVGVKGGKNSHHFRHYIKSNCSGGLETALHLLGKQILEENSKIKLFKDNAHFTYQEVKVEKKFNEIIPDVTAKLESGENIFFEIVVTNPVSEKKQAFYINHKYLSVEINLYSFFLKHDNLNIEDITNKVLNELYFKKVIYWHPKPEVKKVEVLEQTENKTLNKPVLEQKGNWVFNPYSILSIIVGILGFCFFKNKGSKKTKTRSFYRSRKKRNYRGRK